jgi:hypothetical protein
LPKVATGHMLYGNTKRNQASGQLIWLVNSKTIECD